MPEIVARLISFNFLNPLIWVVGSNLRAFRFRNHPADRVAITLCLTLLLLLCLRAHEAFAQPLFDPFPWQVATASDALRLSTRDEGHAHARLDQKLVSAPALLQQCDRRPSPPAAW
jgi:hypothetical protein